MKQQLLKVLFKKLFFISALSCIILAIAGCETTQPTLDENSEKVVTPPYWAPTYDNVAQVHYYYLPDLETYYDVCSNEFIYLDAGQWVFSPFLAPMYSLYDLRYAPVVILDSRVHEPWLHHELYVSHYPRYYFQTISSGPDAVRQRGLDENVNKPVFYELKENPAQNTAAQSLPVMSTSPAMVTPNKRQPLRYNGKTTGHPVKVNKKMMKPKDNGKEKNENKENKNVKEKKEKVKSSKSKPQVSNYKELPIEKR